MSLKTFTILQSSSEILLYLIRRISPSPFAFLLEKFGLEVDQNGLEKIKKFATLFQFKN